MTRSVLSWFAATLILLCAAATAFASDGATTRAHWQASFLSSDALQSSAHPVINFQSSQSQAGQPAPPRRVIEYSDAYRTRARLHKDASFALLPLFGVEGLLGESIYNNPSDGKKTAHIVVGTSILGLFALNSVTGVWNLVEARHDSNDRTRRWVHALLMLGSDAGFIATLASGPGGHKRLTSAFDDQKSTHRALAFTSIGMATGGYLIMLIGRH